MTFVLYYSILWFCFDYATIPYPLAIAVAYSVAIVFHFFGNRKITFNAEKIKFRQQILRYILLALFNYMIQLSAIKLFYGIYGINFYISTFIGVMSTMITGYLLMNSWVFKKRGFV